MLIQQHQLIDDHPFQGEQLRALQAPHGHPNTPLKDVFEQAVERYSDLRPECREDSPHLYTAIAMRISPTLRDLQFTRTPLTVAPELWVVIGCVAQHVAHFSRQLMQRRGSKLVVPQFAAISPAASGIHTPPSVTARCGCQLYHQPCHRGILQPAWVSIDECETTPSVASHVLSPTTACPCTAQGLNGGTECRPPCPIIPGKLGGSVVRRRSHVGQDGTWPCPHKGGRNRAATASL
jgi:hypothetical protein